LAAGIGHEIVLIEYEDDGNWAVCPIMLRHAGEWIDVATPYGFGGFAAHGDCRGLPVELRRFAVEQSWVCGYLALHPLFPHPFTIADGLEQGRTVYVLDLSASEDDLLASMHDTHRYEIRGKSGQPPVFVDTRTAVKALPALYAETLARVGASDTYRFSDATLDSWLSSSGCLALGIGIPPQAVVVCLYTKDVADYFINAGTNQGRRYSRILLWESARELKRRGVRYFNLGGGIRDGDPLDAFKRRFGGDSSSFQVLKQVYLGEKFTALCARAGVVENGKGYFPPYRPP
jgi:hypothetical protein